ncbi:hypothetical protein DFH06DRAFT_505680 [Mycena polygramma]|nr:hypothetical protein DFH06DRAFT_505680 [Mycena polygramma]
MSDSGPGLNFIIVGASVSGLASALSLKASGHSVMVLEKDPELGGTGAVPSGCARVPPNGTKILLDWGMEDAIKANAAVMPGFSVHKYNGGPGDEFIGVNRWDPELLSEARGGYIQFRHRDLIRILYDAAVEAPELRLNGEGETCAPKVTVIFGAEVANIDCDGCSVTLRSGDTHTADAIIGADGVNGVVRRALLEEEDSPEKDGVPTGLAMINAIIPRADIVEQEHAVFYDELGSTVWAGSSRGLMTCPVGTTNDMSLSLFTPDCSQDGTWSQASEKSVAESIGPSAVAIQKIAALAGPGTCVQIKDYHDLQSWVSESGRVLVLGEAAHPSPPGAAHSYSVSLEDGVFIGKVFSHTHSRDRVPEFLYAFQEHREPRCARIRQIEKELLTAITIPDGDVQVGRDAAMRANHAAGRNVMEGDYHQMLDDFRMVFGYDATDDADEWWVSWGRFRDSAGAIISRYVQEDMEDEEEEDFLVTTFQSIVQVS